MTDSETPKSSLATQVLIAVVFLVLGVVITWLGVNDWRIPPTAEDDSQQASRGPISDGNSAPTPTPPSTLGATPSITTNGPTADQPALTLVVDPDVVPAFDAQSDLTWSARLSSDLAPGSPIIFALESAPGLSAFDYSILRKVKNDGSAQATFTMSPCELLDINHQVASAAEGDYVVSVQDMRSGSSQQATFSLTLAPGADDFTTWRSGNCLVY